MSTAFASDITHYSGHLIPEFLMRRRLFRIYYINSFSFSLAGIMESEFPRISLVCEGSLFLVTTLGWPSATMSVNPTKRALFTVLSRDSVPSVERIIPRPGTC